MMTVRYSTGLATTYDRAGFIEWASSSSGYHILRVCKGGSLVVRVPGTATVEFIEADRVEHTGKVPPMTLDAAIGIVAAGIQDVQGYSLKIDLVTIKRKLRSFDARMRCWK